nr:reverse transcriptase domain-containing protein [Tanacetum cinerariifolium]
MSGERHDMIEDDGGKCASLQFVFILKAKSESVPDTLSHWSSHVSDTESTIDDVIYHPLILTPEFGLGVTPRARLTRVVPLCVGTTPHQQLEISSDTERGWFDRFPNGCIDNWTNLREEFVERFALRRKCFKDSTKVAKIVRRANEILPNFKERWTEEMSYIPDVPVIMHISAFMSNSKCPELARRFSDQVLQTVAEMMRRVNDFVKSEKVFKNTELPKGEHPERLAVAQFRGSRPPRHSYGSRPSRPDIYLMGDHYQPYVTPRAPDGRLKKTQKGQNRIKNGKRGEAGKSQKQLQWIEEEKLKKTQKEGPKMQTHAKSTKA